MKQTIVYRRASQFMHRVLEVHNLRSLITWRELRTLMIRFGLASDKLTIAAYRERLEIFGFVKKLGRSGQFQLMHPDIENIVSLDVYNEEKQLAKVTKGA